MDVGTRVVVVIPAIDEEPAIGRVLADIPRSVSEVIVVDNGSRDRTAEVAAAMGATVVREPRRGYGQACLAGIAAAGAADIIVFLDGDGSDHPEQLAEVLGPVARGEADLVIGSRTLGRRAPGAHPWHAVMGTRLCVSLMNRLIGTAATDLGPFRAITASALRRLDMSDRDFGWTVEMQARAALAGWRSTEVPVSYRRRVGVSKITGTVSGTIRAGIKILTTLFLLRLGRATGKVLDTTE